MKSRSHASSLLRFCLLGLIFNLSSFLPAASAQTLNPYARMVDPLAIARLDAPDFAPTRLTYGMGFGYGEDPDYPGYYRYGADTGAGIFTHFFFTARTPDSVTDYKLFIDGQLFRSGSYDDFYNKPIGYMHGPFDTTIGEARLADVQIPYHNGFKILYKTNDFHTWFDYGWKPLPHSVMLPSDTLGSPDLEAEEQAAIKVFNNPASIWQGTVGRDTSVWIGVRAGKDTTLLTLTGPAVISKFWINPVGYDTTLDSVWLDIYYDGADHPAFSSPFLALFGQTFDFREWHSLPMDFSKDSGFTMRLPMPFAHSVRFAIRNRSSHDVAPKCSVTYIAQAVDPAKLGYLHAVYSQIDHTPYHVFHHVLHRKGKGVYVGLLMGVHNLNAYATYEGDAEFMLDSSSDNTFHYEGTEDYFNGAQYFSYGEFDSPFGGTSDRNSAYYRFHYMDAYDFRTSFDFDFQHGNDNDSHENYRTLAFWYEQNIPYWTDRDTVRPGEVWIVSGAGYQPGEHIAINLNSTQVGTLNASADGSFSDPIVLTSGLSGFYPLTVNGVVYPEAILVSEPPTIRIESEPKPLAVQTGDTIHISGEGLNIGETVAITIGGRPAPSHIVIDQNHSYSGWLIAPLLPDGDYTITLVNGGSASITSLESVHITRTLTYQCEDLWKPSSSAPGTSQYLNVGFLYSYDWSQNAVMQFLPSSGWDVSVSFYVPVTDTFRVVARFGRGTVFGDYDVLLDNVVRGHCDGYENTGHFPDTVLLGTQFVSNGTHTLSYHYTGHDPLSTDSVLWADYLQLTPITPFNGSGIPPSFFAKPTDSVAIFPDPADNNITVVCSSLASDLISASITDMLGKEVYRDELRSASPGILRVPVSSLPSGSYVLRVVDGGSVRMGAFRVVH